MEVARRPPPVADTRPQGNGSSPLYPTLTGGSLFGAAFTESESEAPLMFMEVYLLRRPVDAIQQTENNFELNKTATE